MDDDEDVVICGCHDGEAVFLTIKAIPLKYGGRKFVDRRADDGRPGSEGDAGAADDG